MVHLPSSALPAIRSVPLDRSETSCDLVPQRVPDACCSYSDSGPGESVVDGRSPALS